VVGIHATLYTTLLLLTIVLTLWALFFMATSRPVDGAFRSTYLLMVATSVAQATLGVVMLLDDQRPGSSFHYLYGVSLMVFTGAGYAFASRGSGKRETLIYGLASLAAFGLILRAAATASG
jgi:heme A synthase